MLVDFWADWCRPCHMLAPVIEQAVDAHEGKIELAKLDTDSNQATAARYGVRGLPTVKAFRDGEVVDEFTGAQPPLGRRALRGRASCRPRPTSWSSGGDEESLRRALEVDPDTPDRPGASSGACCSSSGETAEALALLDGVTGDFVADGLAARAQLAGDEDLAPAFEAWDARRPCHGAGAAPGGAGGPRAARRRSAAIMVAIFTELGADDPLAREYRRRLSAA